MANPGLLVQYEKNKDYPYVVSVKLGRYKLKTSSSKSEFDATENTILKLKELKKRCEKALEMLEEGKKNGGMLMPDIKPKEENNEQKYPELTRGI